MFARLWVFVMLESKLLYLSKDLVYVAIFSDILVTNVLWDLNGLKRKQIYIFEER